MKLHIYIKVHNFRFTLQANFFRNLKSSGRYTSITNFQIQIYDCISKVEESTVPLHHCQSISGCWSCVDFDSWSPDGGLGLSGFDRHDAAAFSWLAAGSAGGSSADRSTKRGGRVENEESWTEFVFFDLWYQLRTEKQQTLGVQATGFFLLSAL